jgi:2-oxoacid dehydrogenases acyltransferase (catalytic domain)
MNFCLSQHRIVFVCLLSEFINTLMHMLRMTSPLAGMHATKLRPVVVNGKVEARPMMYLALTYDHRLIDGREAVTFLKSVQGKIEDPSKLLLQL